MPLNENMPEEQEPMLSELPPNFTEKLGIFIYMKKSEEPTYKHDFQSIVNELVRMANGENVEGVREDYYPGWTDEHFRLLLKKLDLNF